MNIHSIRFEDTEWETIVAFAKRESAETGFRLSASDIVRSATLEYLKRKPGLNDWGEDWLARQQAQEHGE